MNKGVVAGVGVLVAMVTLASGACPALCRCDSVNKIVNCGNAGLTTIPYDLPDPSGIKHLDLSGNKISSIVADIVSYMNLEVLDLRDNQMLSIDDNVLDALPRLKYLYLQDNHLSSVNTRTFSKLHSLLKLDLSHNRMRSLQDEVFADLTSLEDLNLAGNDINEVGNDAFKGLDRLLFLNLDDNQLDMVPVTALQHTKSLETLSLNFNHIETVSTHAFGLQKELRDLSLEGNELAYVSDSAFHDRESSDMPLLEHLVLKSNKLEVVPTEAFQHLTNLLTLDLSANPIQIISADAFKGLVRLQQVRLNSMPKLETIQKFAFSELGSLSHVEMHSSHALHTIEEGAFIATPSIHYLDLHACGLETLGPSTFEWVELQYLDLRFNPWHCDCRLQWLHAVLAGIQNSSVSKVACTQPDHMSGLLLLEAQPHDFACASKQGHEFQDHIMLAIFASFSGVLLITMCLLFYKGGYFKCNRHSQAVYQRYLNNPTNNSAPNLAEQVEPLDVVQNGHAINAV